MVPDPIDDFDVYNYQYSGWTWRTALNYSSNNVAFFEKRIRVPLDHKEFHAEFFSTRLLETIPSRWYSKLKMW